MASDAQQIRLKLPDQDLRALSLGHAQPRKLQVWVEQLPLMNMGETSRQLYQFIQELNRLQIDTRTRFQLLEIVRPVILHVSDSLGKHYLRQSLVLPDKARRVAGLAQALQGHLASGYKLVAARGIRKVSDKEVRQAVATALHRAFTALGNTLLRCYQLYFPTPRNVWLELHQLYLLAEANDLVDVRVREQPGQGEEETSVGQAYIRILLLATAKPNQLRQQELAIVSELAREAASLVTVRSAAGEDDLFVFDLEVDRPPTYRTHASLARGSCRFIDAQLLVENLAARQPGQNGEGLSLPRGTSEALLMHLQLAWGALTERAFSRISQRLPLDICFGLGALHYFSSDGADFAGQIGAARMRVLDGDGDSPFAGQVRRSASAGLQPSLREEDAWSRSIDGGGRRMADDSEGVESIDISGITAAVQARQASGSPVQQFESYRCETVNVSPGGYCLAWQGETPSQLRTGELVGVREQDHHEWTVGVVRWVKQLTHQGAEFGIELLAPRALPAAARALKKTGDPTEFMRVLLLPELHAIAQEATLLVPAVGFQSSSRVELVRQGVTERVQLARRVSGSASFGQFEFRGQSQPEGSTGKRGSSDDEFRSIWSSL